MTAPPDISRLTYADLPQVIAIERRAFPTPWSLAMFVLELSKPSGICLAARRDGRMCGYLVCSRYDTVWHIMNVSVDPDFRRRGIASALLHKLIERVGDGALAFREKLEPAAIAVPADGHPSHRVSAVAICRLASTTAPVARDALVPDYLRLPDAEETRRRRERR